MQISTSDHLRPFESQSKREVKPFIIMAVIVIVTATAGYVSASLLRTSAPSATTKSDTVQQVSNEKQVGVVDKSTFTDTATGVMREGGFDGEGSFHLERPGGPSQNIYLTSSAVDLSVFTGKKVTVWGQTHKGNKAGWLMDVGLVEVN